MLLDAALPPGAPWWGALLLAAGPGVAAIVIAWLQFRSRKDAPDLAKLEARVAAAEEALAKTVGAEREDLGVMKDTIAALAADVLRLRTEFDERRKADDLRRERAGKAAENDRRELRKEIAGISERVATMAGRLEGMMERSHGRG